jgi:tryptophanyl-tRNA synthetase
MSKPVILTGIRANNDLTIGNYLGALLPIVDMAKQRAGEYQVNLFVPDLHSFTTPIDHAQLHAQIMQNLRVFAAAGLPLDNPDVHIYRQSYVPAHSELTWILDCFTGFGEMNRMTQFKDKSQKLLENVGAVDAKVGESIQEVKERNTSISVGLFNYPVLMAADILLYNAKYVPVGEDQTQHLEFTRDIAGRMNNKFGDLFVVPAVVHEQHAFFGKEQGLRVRDLQDPTKKMSKSDETGAGVIFLSDAPEQATKKVMRAATDNSGVINYDWDSQPGITNLLQIYQFLSGKSHDAVLQEWQGKTQYGEFKKVVAGQVAAFLTDFGSKLVAIDDEIIKGKLAASETMMNEMANATLLRVQKAVGLR